MANTNANKLSASHIRYLLVLKKLAASDLGVRSVELAAELGVSKPSVCNMLCVLAEMKLVDKQPRSIVYLTQAGNQMAKKYSEYYDAVFAILRKPDLQISVSFPKRDYLRKIPIALLPLTE